MPEYVLGSIGLVTCCALEAAGIRNVKRKAESRAMLGRRDTFTDLQERINERVHGTTRKEEELTQSSQSQERREERELNT
jgi:hypothetical protein